MVLTPVNALAIPTGTPHFTLSSGMSDTDSAMTLTDGSVAVSTLPTSKNVRLLIYKIGDTNPEFIDMTSRVTTTLQINRETEEATARPKCIHAAGASVWIVQTAAISSFAGTISFIKRQAGGNYNTTSATFVAIDSTNLTLTLQLNIGDTVELIFEAQTYNSGSNAAAFDAQITQPDTTIVRANNSSDHGISVYSGTNNRIPINFTAYFVATQTGAHIFAPVWLTNGGTQTLANSVAGGFDQTAIIFSARNISRFI